MKLKIEWPKHLLSRLIAKFTKCYLCGKRGVVAGLWHHDSNGKGRICCDCFMSGLSERIDQSGD